MVTLGDQTVDMIVVSLAFCQVRVFLADAFLNDLFEKLKWNKCAWLNPMGSTQWKSLYERYISTFSSSWSVRFLEACEKMKNFEVHLALLYLLKLVTFH